MKINQVQMESNKIEVPSLNQVGQKERLEIICSEIVKGTKKTELIKKYMKQWGCSKYTIRAIINEAIIFLFQENPHTREDIRSLNLARLDDVYEDCQTVRDKIKCVDTINKTAGIYEQTINLGNKDSESFKFDIGVSTDDN